MDPKADWKSAHGSLYSGILAHLTKHPPSGSAHYAFWTTVPDILDLLGPTFGFVVKKGVEKTYTYRPVKDGEACLYWDGALIREAAFDRKRYWLSDYVALVSKIVGVAGLIDQPP